MKTSIRIASIAILFLTIAFSCSKDKTVTPMAVTNGTLLAGANGQSKTWKLISITELDSTTTSTLYTVSYSTAQNSIPSCVSDNVYTFSNNSTQNYQLTEGASLCNQSDVSQLEVGSWALTNDGKGLVIEASDNAINADTVEVNEIENGIKNNTDLSSDPELFLAYYYLISSDGELKVKQITSTSMILVNSGSSSYTDPNTGNPVSYGYKITLTFSSTN